MLIGHCETGLRWSSHRRSTPELDELRAHLSALMPYRVAADVLGRLLPVEARIHHETLRSHTRKAGEQLLKAAPETGPTNDPETIVLTVDSTFVRSCHDSERHFEVRVGNVETAKRGRQVFAAVAGIGANIAALIRRSLAAVGQTAETAVIAFTDGCPGLQTILTEAGLTKPPIADWFHIAMRLQHATQTANGLSTDHPRRARAKEVIIAEVDRLK